MAVLLWLLVNSPATVRKLRTGGFGVCMAFVDDALDAVLPVRQRKGPT